MKILRVGGRVVLKETLTERFSDGQKVHNQLETDRRQQEKQEKIKSGKKRKQCTLFNSHFYWSNPLLQGQKYKLSTPDKSMHLGIFF